MKYSKESNFLTKSRNINHENAIQMIALKILIQGWDREGGREGDARGKRCGNICICITDSLCYKAETNTLL